MSDSFFAYIRTRGQGPIKLGITASKKVGKAHDRNRYKRLAREAFRLSELRQLKGYDVVLVIKQESPPATLHALTAELELLARRLSSGELASSKAKGRKPSRRANGRRGRASASAAPPSPHGASAQGDQGGAH